MKDVLNSDKSLISVITVVYNGAKEIETTIKSLLQCKDIDRVEYIIIDGGSTDGTVNIIKQYSNNVFYWISEPDMGIYDAMNKGIAKATGEWVFFLNTGDRFYNELVFRDIFSSKIDNSIQVLFGNYAIAGTNKLVKPNRLINKKYFFAETICHQTVFCRRNLFDKTGSFNLKYKIIADRDWLLRCIIAKVKFMYIDINVCFWEPVGFSLSNITLFKKEEHILQQTYFNKFDRFILNSKRYIIETKIKLSATIKIKRNKSLLQ